MLQITASVWRPSRGMDAFEVGENLFRFDFYHEKELDRILEDGSWGYENNTLLCRKIDPGVPPHKVGLNTIDFWVQIHDIPSNYASTRCLNRSGLPLVPEYAFGPWLSAVPRKTNLTIGQKWIGKKVGKIDTVEVGGSLRKEESRMNVGVVSGGEVVPVDAKRKRLDENGTMSSGLIASIGDSVMTDVSKNMHAAGARFSYGKDHAERLKYRIEESWNLFRSLWGQSDLPRVVIGDFNDLCSQSEKRVQTGVDLRVSTRGSEESSTVPLLMPNIGYGSDKKTRHYLPNDFEKFLVHNVKELELLLMLNTTYCVEIVHDISTRKRKVILEHTFQLDVAVTNKLARLRSQEVE
ncbi:hypothetical protein OROMI_022155 [Orobanche minor]